MRFRTATKSEKTKRISTSKSADDELEDDPDDPDRASQLSCGICGKVFQKSEQLEVHLRAHAGQKPFPCKVCGKAFTRKASMMEHVARHQGIKDKLCQVNSLSLIHI